MRFNAAVASAVYSSAVLLGSVHAQDAAESSAAADVPKPSFTVSPSPLAGLNDDPDTNLVS